MKQLRLLLIAVIGSILGFYLINAFVTPVNVWQYISIELIVTLLHALYNLAKRQEQII
jgi:uncharacterized protein (DUF983 family)